MKIVMKLIPLSFLMLLLTSCGKIQQQVVVKTEYIQRDIPKELLTLEPLQKTYAKDDKDIIYLYSILFKKYKECENKINAIKELNLNKE